MAYETIEVQTMAGSLGAEISGAEQTNLTNQAIREIHKALLEHQVMYFDDVSLDDDQL